MGPGKGAAAAGTGGGERPLCPLILWEVPPPGSRGDHTGFSNNRESRPIHAIAITCHNAAVPVYAALLRGINVGRNKRVAMADLRALMDGLGYASVRTHLQSGNVVFESPKRSGKPLEAVIEAAIAAELGMDVTVIVRRSDELARVIAGSPFEGRTDDHKRLHVAFLSEPPKAAAVKAFDAAGYAPDELQVVGREAYLLYPDGYAQTKLTNAVIEKALGVRATSRNWRTVTALADLTAKA
jgi:uncharacterized protein (DUF1697 family)